MSTLSFSSFGINPSVLVIYGAVLTFSYLFYLWLLPRPIPGIPYNKEATKSIFGDIGSLMKHVSKTQQMFEWITIQSIKLNSPIIQVFARPFSKPWVVVTDYREAQDILLRRTKEFDRSNFFGDIFSGIMPEHHINMKTNETFKQHRRWLQDLMTPDFLHNIAAPRIYASFEDVVQLWDAKARLAAGHPFPAAGDIYRGALDAVWAAVFGSDPSTSSTVAQVKICSSAKAVVLPSDIDEETILPVAPNPPALQAVITLGDSLETTIKSPVPRLAHWVLRQMPYMRKATAIKDQFIAEEVEKTRKRFVGEEVKDVRCAMDDIIRREMLLSEKEGRKPILHSRAMYDEIFGFMVGAHETTSTTLCWSLKILADQPLIQNNLRSALQTAYSSAYAERRNPTAQEIIKTSIPYLDACMEELFRCSGTAPGVMRTTVVDADVLGHKIPAGTDVFFMTAGPSMDVPAFPIDDSLRSPSFLAAKSTVGQWDPEDMGIFKPERWLVVNEEGKKEFNSSAGPILAFSLGPRGCFGRRLAYLEMRLVLVLLLWNFELEKCPVGLAGYEATDKITHQPQKCYVRLRKL